MHAGAALVSAQGFADSCAGIFRSSPEPMAPSECPWPEDMTDDDNTSDLALQTSFSSLFLNEAVEKISLRATDESWTQDDVTSALLHTALVSYRCTAQELRGRVDFLFLLPISKDYAASLSRVCLLLIKEDHSKTKL